MSNHNLSQDVIRCAKQVYTHLRQTERIKLLSGPKSSLPLEVNKMQELLAFSDKTGLNEATRSFLSLPSPPGKQKTIQDYINLINEKMLVDQVDFGDDFDDELLTQIVEPPKPTSSINTNIVLTPELMQALESIKSLEVAQKPTQVAKTNKRTCEYDEPVAPSKKLKIPTCYGDCFTSVSNAGLLNNVICNPAGHTAFFEGVPWITLYEISRFIQSCKIPWNEIPFTAFHSFIHTAATEPKKLYEQMMGWNQEVRLGRKLNGLAYTVMERCPENVWSYLQRLEKETQASTTPTVNKSLLSPVSPKPVKAQVSKIKNRVIRYSAILQFKAVTQPPTITLRAPKVESSNRFFRKFGPERFLELKLSKSSHANALPQYKSFFMKPFLFMHRTFRFLFIKDDTVILFATEGIGLNPINIQQVVEWHMPIVENWTMTMCKYASRMSLGYSSSIPTFTFEKPEIRYVDDVYAGNSHDESACMTDGCGIISASAMKMIMGCQTTDELPCAVQGRVAGAKGIWIISPDLSFTSGKYIEIRKSQHKFNTGIPQDDLTLDPLHYTFDLVKNSICVYPSNLNTQFIQALAAGGVPTHVFVEILKEYTSRLGSVITEHQNVKLLRDWVAKQGNIMNGRWESESGTEKGLWHDQMGHMEDETDSGFYDDEDTNSDDALINSNTIDQKIPTSYPQMQSDAMPRITSYNKINKHSGIPAGLHESVVRLLDAGFDLSNAYVATRVTQVFRQVMRAITTKYKIEVAQSCTVTCIPDPTNTLKPGQVFLQLSSRRVDEITGIRAGQILGDCIVTRNPCGLKSDVQKVTAVDCTELRMYTDIIVFPVQGDVSLASKLSGGDYDGDIVFCCWDERIVKPFTSSAVPQECDRVKRAFHKNEATLGEIIGSHNHAEEAIQNSFFSVAMPDGTLGTYENWRTVLAEQKSLDDPDVIYLAQMCAKLVDAPKQGLQLTSITKSRDRNNFANLAHSAWFMDKKNKQRERTMNSYKLINNVCTIQKTQAETTMDHLYDTLQKETAAFTRYSRSLFSEEDVPYKDNDLSTPWIKAMTVANLKGNESFKQDLELVAKLIRNNRDDYNTQVQDFQLQRSHYMDNIRNPSRYSENKFQDELQSRFENYLELEEYFAKEFNDLPNVQDLKSSVLLTDIEINNGKMLQVLKASYAYTISVNLDKYGKYAYIVAYDILRRIKADACALLTKDNGLAESVSVSSYKSLNIDRKWLKRIKESSYIEPEAERVRLVPALNEKFLK